MAEGSEKTVNFYFRTINNLMRKSLNRQLKDLDLTKSQLDILSYLAHQKEPVIQRDIENFFHISNPTVTGLLNRLEQKGYIERKSCESDKRIRFIQLTEKELELRKRFERDKFGIDAACKEILSDEEEKELICSLKKLMKYLVKKEDELD